MRHSKPFQNCYYSTVATFWEHPSLEFHLNLPNCSSRASVLWMSSCRRRRKVSFFFLTYSTSFFLCVAGTRLSRGHQQAPRWTPYNAACKVAKDESQHLQHLQVQWWSNRLVKRTFNYGNLNSIWVKVFKTSLRRCSGKTVTGLWAAVQQNSPAIRWQINLWRWVTPGIISEAGVYFSRLCCGEQAGVHPLCCWREASLPVNVPSNKAMNITGQIVCDW